ncbi:sulfurtransferase [Catellatospora methionotrophica]|uniref:Sulfurtransferase n=1 Tax=Catellatospora methionotrophica TaxID=121620 RepID=A0A8J3PE16_9ACTN|nr:rhodanese-like domain-containing protein [Catellatospora methionotrophica]GIG14071.1 sulfurtransferase [Catellatospora methionotrophica]
MFAAQIPTATVAEVPADAFLLDVREDDEWAAGHAPDAVHLPMMQIPARMAEVPTDREVFVLCRVGGRSGQVVSYLRQQGWDNVTNVDGGMMGWAAAGRPVVAVAEGLPPQII